MLSAASLKGGVVLYEEGLDPADMVKEGRTKELQKLFNSPKPFIEFCIEQIAKKYNLRDPLQKEQALKEGVNYLATLSKLLQAEYKEYLAAVLDISSSLIKLKPDKNFNNPLPIRAREDIAELALIKTLLNNPKLIEMVLDAIDEDMFKTHKSEFLSVIRGHLDKPALVGITLRDDIKAHSEKELKNQLCFFLAKYYNSELKKITKNQTLSFEKKNFMIRKLQEKISRLKKGELVAYESFGTI
jgi:DNA primase